MVFCYRHDGSSWATTSALSTAGCSSTRCSRWAALPAGTEFDLYFVSWFGERARYGRPALYVAGWTDPVKASLGARFAFTGIWSGAQPILRRILYMFRHWFESTQRPWARRRLIRIRIMHDPANLRSFQPVILDFDSSVLPVARANAIPLGSAGGYAASAVRAGHSVRWKPIWKACCPWIAAVRSWAAAISTTSR